MRRPSLCHPIVFWFCFKGTCLLNGRDDVYPEAQLLEFSKNTSTVGLKQHKLSLRKVCQPKKFCQYSFHISYKCS